MWPLQDGIKILNLSSLRNRRLVHLPQSTISCKVLYSFNASESATCRNTAHVCGIRYMLPSLGKVMLCPIQVAATTVMYMIVHSNFRSLMYMYNKNIPLWWTIQPVYGRPCTIQKKRTGTCRLDSYVYYTFVSLIEDNYVQCCTFYQYTYSLFCSGWKAALLQCGRLQIGFHQDSLHLQK